MIGALRPRPTRATPAVTVLLFLAFPGASRAWAGLAFEPVVPLVGGSDTVSLATDEQRTWAFSAPSPRPGAVIALRARARIDTPSEGGDNWFLQLTVNGKGVMAVDPDVGVTRLLDRPLECTFRTGLYHPEPWYQGGKWLLHCAPSFEAIASPASPYAVVEPADPATYLLDITDLLGPGTNTVTLRNDGKWLEPVVGRKLPMIVAELLVGYVAEDTVYGPNPDAEPLRVSAAARLVTQDVRVSVALLRSRDVPAGSSVRLALTKPEGGPTVATAEFRDILRRRRGSIVLRNAQVPPASYPLTAAIISPDGKEVAAVTGPFEKPAPPPWLGTTLGRSERVLPPWSPLRVQGSEVRCWGRAYDFGDHLLPVSINTGAQVLARAVRLMARVGGKDVAWDPVRSAFTQVRDAVVERVARTSSPALRATARTTVEYDGMMRVELTLTPRAAGQG